MSFFSPTQEEINKSAGGFIKFKEGEAVGFTFTEVVEEEPNGRKRIRLKAQVMTGDHQGKPYTLFINDTSGGWKMWMGIMECTGLKSQLGPNFSPSLLVGKQVVATVNYRDHNGKEYDNWTKWKSAGAPVIDQTSDIPF